MNGWKTHSHNMFFFCVDRTQACKRQIYHVNVIRNRFSFLALKTRQFLSFLSLRFDLQEWHGFFSSGNYSFRRVIFVVQTHSPLMPALKRVRKISVVSFVFVEVYALYDIIKWIHDIMHGQKYSVSVLFSYKCHACLTCVRRGWGWLKERRKRHENQQRLPNWSTSQYFRIHTFRIKIHGVKCKESVIELHNC